MNKRLTFDVPEELHSKLKSLCANRGVSIRSVILMMIEVLLDQELKPTKPKESNDA